MLIHQYDTGAVLTVSSVLANSGTNATSLTKAGPGMLVLTGANKYTGVTTVGGGTLQGTTATIPTAVALQNGANVTFNQTSSGTLGNAVSGLCCSASSARVLTVKTAQSYLGTTLISGGTLRLARNTSPATTGVNITASGAVLDLKNNSQTIEPLTGVSGGTVTLGSGALTTGGDGTSTTFAGVISGAGSLTKVGSGVFTFSGA